MSESATCQTSPHLVAYLPDVSWVSRTVTLSQLRKQYVSPCREHALSGDTDDQLGSVETEREEVRMVTPPRSMDTKTSGMSMEATKPIPRVIDTEAIRATIERLDYGGRRDTSKHQQSEMTSESTGRREFGTREMGALLKRASASTKKLVRLLTEKDLSQLSPRGLWNRDQANSQAGSDHDSSDTHDVQDRVPVDASFVTSAGASERSGNVDGAANNEEYVGTIKTLRDKAGKALQRVRSLTMPKMSSWRRLSAPRAAANAAQKERQGDGMPRNGLDSMPSSKSSGQTRLERARTL